MRSVSKARRWKPTMAQGSLQRCRDADILDEEDDNDLRQLMARRNPLTHFRNVDDERNLDRRSISTGRHSSDLLGRDARFALTLASRMLGTAPFRLDDEPETLPPSSL